MYSKEEAFQIRKKFWISFGQYMKLHKSVNGKTINWLNYKTGIKDLYFKIDVDNKSAKIAIEITQKDKSMQSLIFEQFEVFQPIFELQLGKWDWLQNIYDGTGKGICRIECQLKNVSIFNEYSWQEIIIFLKDNLLKLDKFWEDVKDSFEVFR
ncbi:MAG: DUF4268 domain-containing protein [Moheibacter sp.]